MVYFAQSKATLCGTTECSDSLTGASLLVLKYSLNKYSFYWSFGFLGGADLNGVCCRSPAVRVFCRCDNFGSRFDDLEYMYGSVKD